MNILFSILLLFVFQYSIAQNDYVMDFNGLKNFGTITSGSAISSTQVIFKNSKGVERTYNAGQVKEWKQGDMVYHSRPYQISKSKEVTVFMRLLNDSLGTVNAYEFYNAFAETAYIITYLEKNGVMTEVKFGKFRKQMEEYFQDQPEVVAMIGKGGVKKNDLVLLVRKYNELTKPVVVEEVPAEEIVVTRTEPNTPEKKTAKPVWNFDDMLLSPEAAAKKYLADLAEKNKNIRDQTLKDITINTELGTSFFDQKQYDAAAPYLKKAYTSIQQHPDLGQEFKPKLEIMLATIYINNQRHDLAVDYNTGALNDLKNNPTNENLNYLYIAYLNQGKIFKNLEASDENINFANATGHGNWEASLKSAKLSPVVHASKPEKSKDYNIALLYFKQAQNLIGQFPPELHTGKQIEAQLELGALYFEAGDYTNSKTYYSKVLDLMKSKYGNKHPQQSQTARILSEICLAEQLFNEALSYINQAQYVGDEAVVIDRSLLENINKIPFPFDLLNSIVTQGIILYEQNKKNPSEAALKKVLGYYSIAAELLHQLRNTHRNEGSDFRLANVTHRLSQHAVVICNTLFQLTKKEEYLEQAFFYAELSKSAVLYETIHDLKSMEVSGIPKDKIVKENGLKVQIAYLKGEVFYELQQGDTKNETRLKALQEKIEKITKEHEAMLVSFEKEYPEYYALKYNHKSITLKELQQNLQANEVFLEYVTTDSFIYVLAVAKDAVKSQFSRLDEPLSHLVKKLQYALKKNQPDIYENNGQILYEKAIGGLSSFIANKKLIIAPDGELHYIPFGVLPTHKTKTQGKGSTIYKEVHFFIRDHAICYNHSANLFLLSLNTKSKGTGYSISTWAPNFDVMSKIIKEKGIGESLAPLPGAAKEAELIAKMFNSTAYIAENASEWQFKQTAGQYSVLHIATHGLLNDLDPLFSSLVLTNKDDEDGILHAFELYNMRLNAELAVLSACNSGMGKLTKGEGVVSIARGFAYAGVPNIVMSKWPVSDWSTAVLMRYFYKNLKAGMPKDEALQQANIQYLEDNKDKPELLAPFFWGSFVLSGNTRPIEALDAGPNYLLYGGIGAVLLLGGVVFWRRRKQQQP